MSFNYNKMRTEYLQRLCDRLPERERKQILHILRRREHNRRQLR